MVRPKEAFKDGMKFDFVLKSLLVKILSRRVTEENILIL